MSLFTKNLILSVTAATMLLLSGCGDTTDDTTETSKHFSYGDNTVPAVWYKLTDENGTKVNETCKNGLDFTIVGSTGSKHQSPVDLNKTATENTLLSLENYNHKVKSKIVNNGHTIELEPEEESNYLVLNNVQYHLAQFHFHALSEHTVNGKHSDMEMRFVNKSEDGEVAVLGVLIDESNDGAQIFTDIFNKIPAQGEENEIELAPSDLFPLMNYNNANKYFSYNGSFTTPPCTEDVEWNIFEAKAHISADAHKNFTAVYDHNYRPLTGQLK